MPTVGDVLRSLADPFAPLLRERIERALPPGAKLGRVTLEGTSLRFDGLGYTDGDISIVAERLACRFLPRALLGNAPKLTLIELEGTATIATSGGFLRATFRFEPDRSPPHSRALSWASGTLHATLGALSLRASIDTRDDGIWFRDVQCTSDAGTNVRGSVTALDHGLTGRLAGPLFAADLPLEALLPSRALPVDLRELSMAAAIEISGRRASPSVRVDATVHDTPLRAPGQKRYVPHLRIKDGHVGAHITQGGLSGEGRCVLVGGGEVSTTFTRTFTGAATLDLRASLAGLSSGVVRHLLDLAGARGFAWDSGTIDGTLTLTDRPALAPATSGLHLEAKLSSEAPILGVGSACFPLTNATAHIEGDVRSPAVRISARLDGGELVFSRSTDPAADLSLSLRGASPRVLARLSLADPTMLPLVVEGDPVREGAWVLPSDLTLCLFANPKPDDLSADVLLEGHGTRIRVEVGTSEGTHVRSRISGTLAVEHAHLLLSVDTRAKGLALEGEPLSFDLSIVGSQVAPSLLGVVGSGRLVVAYEGRSLPLDGARANVHVAPSFVAFHDLCVGVGAGFVRGAGVAVLGRDGPTLRGSFLSENIRLGRTDLFPEGAPLDGRAFAHAEVRHGRDGTHAELRLRVEGPTYAFLPKATARLERFGLPSVPIDGDSALEAHALFSPELVRVADFRASVPGLRARASGEARNDGAGLRADVRVTASRAWLSRSVLLTLPGALLGTVEVPVEVRGSVARPETRSELAKAIFTSLSRGLFSRADRSLPAVLALGPASLRIPETPYPIGSDEAAKVHALVLGTLPPDSLAELAVRFVEPEHTNG